MVNQRPTIFKILKQHGKYERKHFSMKLVDLLEEMKSLGINFSDEEPEPKKVDIAEPQFSDEEEEVQPVQPVKPKKEKKVKPKIKENLVEFVEEVEKPKKLERINNNADVKLVQRMLADFKDDAIELLNEYDDVEELSQDDIDYIENTFEKYINIVYDNLDKITDRNNFDEQYKNLINKKIKTIFDLKEKFLNL